ncbi:hypothetical protein, partial [Chryseobacterium sp.]|uniref:hypothetical protein n=1 Tax=Chryseobacterium sp. TaxID=1871047 RepID=UPI002FC7E6C9
MLINPATEEAVNLLVQRGFYHNRKFDRFLSYSNTIFAMNEYSKHYHSGLAHLYPLISDKFAEI